MEKMKFTVKGMRCKSCATLIEEKLKQRAGVISIKVNHENHKGVVIFDASKINKNSLLENINSIGDYQAEAEADEEYSPLQENKCSNNKNSQLSSSRSFVSGFLLGFSLISLFLNIFLFSALIKNGNLTNIFPKKISDTPAIAKQLPAEPSDNNEPPPIQEFNVTKNDHVRGNFDASITLIEFSDFECPYCGRFYPVLKNVLNEYKDRVRLVYKHFPLSFHPNSQKAAMASECADEQDKFWAYHDKLFENQASGYSVDKFKQWAKNLGLNSKKFNDCLDADKYAAKITADTQEGENKGVRGTPATFINGELISGAVPYESFKQILDRLIAQ